MSQSHPSAAVTSGRTRVIVRGLAVAAIGAVGALVAVAATGGAARSAAPPPPLATKTHLGASARDHVVLSLTGTPAPRQFRRVLKDGTVEAMQFVVPRGAALHVTDIEFVGGWLLPARGPSVRALRVELVSDANTSSRGTVAFVSPLSVNAPNTGTAIYDVGGSRATTGIIVGFGAHLEVDAPEFLNAVNGDPTPQPFHGDVVVRGYLVKDR
jgi:hypothetical protein